MLPVQFTPYGAHLSRRRGSMMRAMTDSLGWRSQQLPSPPEKDLGLFHRARNGIVLANSHVHGAAGSQLNPCRDDQAQRRLERLSERNDEFADVASRLRLGGVKHRGRNRNGRDAQEPLKFVERSLQRVVVDRRIVQGGQ